MTKHPRAKGNVRGEKKIRKNLMLTPTAVEHLSEKAEVLGLSISEYLERFARGELPDVLITPEPEALVALTEEDRYQISKSSGEPDSANKRRVSRSRNVQREKG